MPIYERKENTASLNNWLMYIITVESMVDLCMQILILLKSENKKTLVCELKTLCMQIAARTKIKKA